MQLRWLAVPSCLIAAVGLAACGGGGGGGGGGKAKGTTLTIYSSLPLQGAARAQSQAIVNGAKLALKNKGGKVGKYKIHYVSLDDATAAAGKADPGQTSSNARKAAQDKTTIAYIGEYNSGATAVSLPILNQAGIPQVSPANTGEGITTNGLGAGPGEPNKYYPTGKRTYARVVPRDSVQGPVDLVVANKIGCKTLYIVNDKTVYGAGLATIVQKRAPDFGVKIVGNDGYDVNAANYRGVAAKINATKPDCVFQSDVTEQNGVQLTKDLAAGVPNAKIIGPDGIAQDAHVNPKNGGVPLSIDSKLYITIGTLPADKQPPAGLKFFESYKKAYGVSNPDPYAIYGYEAMDLVLDAIRRAGNKGNDRNAVNDAIHSTKNKQSVLGTYSIDKNGDTSLTKYTAYRVKNGALVFFHEIDHDKIIQ